MQKRNYAKKPEPNYIFINPNDKGNTQKLLTNMVVIVLERKLNSRK